MPNAPNGFRQDQVARWVSLSNPTDLQALVWEWRDANPDGSQADMRRDLENAGVEIARGYAHELWHRYGNERQEQVR